MLNQVLWTHFNPAVPHYDYHHRLLTVRLEWRKAASSRSFAYCPMLWLTFFRRGCCLYSPWVCRVCARWSFYEPGALDFSYCPPRLPSSNVDALTAASSTPLYFHYSTLWLRFWTSLDFCSWSESSWQSRTGFQCSNPRWFLSPLPCSDFAFSGNCLPIGSILSFRPSPLHAQEMGHPHLWSAVEGQRTLSWTSASYYHLIDYSTYEAWRRLFDYWRSHWSKEKRKLSAQLASDTCC